MSSRVEAFRSRLQYVIDTMDKRDRDKYTDGVLSVTRTIKKDFDRFFPPEVFSHTAANLASRANKVCHKKGCPLCGGKLVVRNGKHGKFLGCQKYPSCKGIRKANNYDIVINDAAREFIADKEHKLEVKKLTDNMGRFDMWEADNEY